MAQADRGWWWLARLFRWSVLGFAFVPLGVFAYATAKRVGYPFSLEWMESGAYDTLAELVKSGRIYGPPGVEFIPFNYTPLYFEASALAARVLGLGFAPLRAISLLAAYGTMVLAFLLARRCGAGLLPSLTAAVTFAATYALTDTYLDTARPDSLYTFLLAAGVLALLHAGPSRWPALLAGFLFGLAYLAKQSAVPALALLLVYLLVRRTSVFVLVSAGIALSAVSGVVWQTNVTHGWFGYYTIKIAAGYQLSLRNLPHFALSYLAPLGVAVLFGVAWIAWPVRSRTAATESLIAAAASILFGCFWLTLYPGTAANVAIPAALACAVLLGLGLDSVLQRSSQLAAGDAARLAVIAYAAVALQWGGLLYAPGKYVPDARDLAAGRRLVERIAAEPGDVFIPNHGYLGRLAGKPGQVHAMALSNAVHGDGHGPAMRVMHEIDSCVAAGRYSMLMLDETSYLARDSIPGYGPPVELFTDRDVFQARVGSRTRPEVLRMRVPGSATP